MVYSSTVGAHTTTTATKRFPKGLGPQEVSVYCVTSWDPTSVQKCTQVMFLDYFQVLMSTARYRSGDRGDERPWSMQKRFHGREDDFE